MKKIYILNGVGASGKGTFVDFVSKYVPTHKYSIVDLPKEAAKVLGWDGGKTERDRKFLSDIVDLSSEYNDSPFRDVLSVVADFENNLIESKALFIDMRDPKDIARAVETFGAEAILIENPSIAPIKSNHADANVKNYKYDYIIKNDDSIEKLDKMANIFARHVIRGKHISDKYKPLVFKCSNY